MKFLDLFSGIGGFRLGLERAGHTCVGHVEIDKFAQQSYNAIHKPREDEFFHADITTIGDDELQDLKQRGIEIITGGFPCQSFSIAGHRKGFEDTRGTLFFDIAKLAKEIQPKYLFLENVKGLLNHDKGDTFEVILRTLDEIGYDAEWQVLNSKHFGVPQNRERVFIIGHLRGSGGGKVFPITGQGGQVDDEFEINQIGNLIDTESFGGNPQVGRVYGIDGISPCLNTMGGGGREPKIAMNINRGKISCRKDNTSTCIDANYYKGLDNHGARTGVVVKEATSIRETKDGFHLARNDKKQSSIQGTHVTYPSGVSHCLSTAHVPMTIENKVAIKEATKQGYAIAEPGDSINLEQPNSKTRRGRVGKGVANTLTTSCNQAVVEPMPIKLGNIYKSGGQNGNVYDIEGVSPTISSGATNTKGNGGIGSNNAPKIIEPTLFRIRKLTPKECWRLQGFPDWSFERAKAAGVSDSQLYKQAGNSVTVNVVHEIAKRLK